MLYHWRWLIPLPTLFLGLSPGFAESNPTGFSRPHDPMVLPSEVDTLVCYMETGSGEIINLERICNPAFDPAGDRVLNPEAACYFVDTNGRPCPPKSE
ncbi:hypothetical protein XM38_028700 [Halomicronema hongdechloris C2206]|uniref:Uncharacterized protein n=1 Tax=Halomicronema hongdechloris C2206 TaxID=1641165 RepID=A0A1Z3HNQ9_9CYAN|nr:hypothetical protein [Halomicronema hongdechloris]ASC71916.1 hypothetical protein XM38_028700 [Halomicronema hongdechloris C2206]